MRWGYIRLSFQSVRREFVSGSHPSALVFIHLAGEAGGDTKQGLPQAQAISSISKSKGDAGAPFSFSALFLLQCNFTRELSGAVP